MLKCTKSFNFTHWVTRPEFSSRPRLMKIDFLPTKTCIIGKSDSRIRWPFVLNVQNFWQRRTYCKNILVGLKIMWLRFLWDPTFRDWDFFFWDQHFLNWDIPSLETGYHTCKIFMAHLPPLPLIPGKSWDLVPTRRAGGSGHILLF